MTELRDGLRDRLATIATLRAYSEEPDDVNVAQGKAVAFPVPSEGDDDTFAGTERTLINVVVLVAPAVGPGRARAQRMVDPYVNRGDPSNIKAAIEEDKTLGGVAHDLNVMGWSRYGLIQVGDLEFWGVMRSVEIWH